MSDARKAKKQNVAQIQSSTQEFSQLEVKNLSFLVHSLFFQGFCLNLVTPFMRFRQIAKLRGTSKYFFFCLKAPIQSAWVSRILNSHDCKFMRLSEEYHAYDIRSLLFHVTPYIFSLDLLVPNNTWHIANPSREEIFSQGLRSMKPRDNFGFLVDIDYGIFRGYMWKEEFQNAQFENLFADGSDQHPFKNMECCSWTLIAYIIMFLGNRCAENVFFDICFAAVCAYGLEDGLQRLVQTWSFAFKMRYRVKIPNVSGDFRQGVPVRAEHLVDTFCHIFDPVCWEMVLSDMTLENKEIVKTHFISKVSKFFQ